MEAQGRINPATYQADPTLRNLADVVPYGLPATQPVHTRPALKEVWPGLHDSDHIVLWGGGLWPWLDPQTAVYAIAAIWQQRQDVKLVFPGTKHPNPAMASMPTRNQDVVHLADQLGLLDRAVFFGDWIPYADRANVLLESDVALTLHYDSYESRLAFRSRVLEYIWAGIPIVATRGDATSDLVDRYNLGITVDCGDVEGVTTAILHRSAQPVDAYKACFDGALARADLGSGR